MLNRIRHWLTTYGEQRTALQFAMRRFESTHSSPADPELSYVYLRAGDNYYVEVQGLWASQWYRVQANEWSIEEVRFPTMNS